MNVSIQPGTITAKAILFRQTKVLMHKNYLLLLRKWPTTIIRAFLLPLALMIFLSYCRFLFFPTQNLGYGDPAPLKSLKESIDANGGKLVFVRGHLKSGADRYIKNLVSQEHLAETQWAVVDNERNMSAICPMNRQGSTPCFAGLAFRNPAKSREAFYDNATFTFYLAPERENEIAYLIFVPPSLRFGLVDIKNSNSPIQTHVLPLQYAMDCAIAPKVFDNKVPKILGYSLMTMAQQKELMDASFMRAVARFLFPAFYIALIGVVYHLSGLFAAERENGTSALLRAHGVGAIPRYAAWHFTFSILNIPAAVIGSGVMAAQLFHHSSAAIIVGWHILSLLSLVSFAIFAAAFFKRSQLAAVAAATVSMVMATGPVILTFGSGYTTAKSGMFIAFSVFFPPVNYISFLSCLAGWEASGIPIQLSKTLAAAELELDRPRYTFGGPAMIPGGFFFALGFVHLLFFPVLGALVERFFYSPKTGGRRKVIPPRGTEVAIKLSGFSQVYKNGFRAVDNFELSVRHGEIVALLGVNGSGKSTTLQAIAGTGGISGGSVRVAAPVGVCPQSNVLWDALTVEEHVLLWAGLKSGVAGDIITECDLWQKRKAAASSLSGGQKRKLQLAIMLLGKDGGVCCMDELSSGLDPLSRQKLHDIILRQRGKRAVLFTTHYLDEADLLADRIVMVAKGIKRAEGTPAELKENLGNGFRIKSSAIVGGTSEWTVNRSADVTSKINFLEHHGGTNLTVTAPTLEDVFLNIFSSSSTSQKLTSEADSSSNVTELDSDALLSLPNTKKQTFWGEVAVTFGKRWTIAWRNWMPLLAVILVPILCAVTTRGLVASYTGNQCGSPSTKNQKTPRLHKRGEGLERRDFDPLATFRETYLLLGPYKHWTAEEQKMIQFLSGKEEGGVRVRWAPDKTSFEKTLEQNYSNIPVAIYHGSDGEDTLGLNMQLPLYYSAKPLNMLNQVRLGEAGVATTIYTGVSTFAEVEVTPKGFPNALIFIFFTGFSMSLVAAFAALYPTFERVSKVRSLHFTNGLRPAPLWLGHLLFESVIAIVASLIASTLIATNNPDIWYQAWHLPIIFALYAIASTLFSFVLSHFSHSALAAFPITAAILATAHTIYTVMNMLLLSIGSAKTLSSTQNSIYHALAPFFPIVSLDRALFTALNIFSTACGHSSGGIFHLYGGPVFFLILQSFLFYGFLVYRDLGYPLRRSTISLSMPARRLSKAGTTADPLVVRNLTKQYRHHTAVENLSFSLPSSTTLSLLGPNGAGKSTTLSLLTGTLTPPSGFVSVSGRNPIHDRRELGVCPQHNAFDPALTVLQTLSFYASLKGIPANTLPHLISAIGLAGSETKRAFQLSGGNQRRLGLAIALLGNPKVLVLDEVSAGMDALGMRRMWALLRRASKGRAMVVVTHSMEEAEACGDRIGILGGRLLAEGSGDEMKLREEARGCWVRVHNHGRDSDDVRAMLGGERTVDGRIRVRGKEVGWVYRVMEKATERGIVRSGYEIAHGGLAEVFMGIVGKWETENNEREDA